MKEDIKRFFEYVWMNHRGKAVGTSAGVIIGMAVLLFGFWHTIFVLLCGCIGLKIGMKVDREEDLWKDTERWRPPFFRR